MISLGRHLGSLLLGLATTALLVSGLAVALPIGGWSAALGSAARSAAIVDPVDPVTLPAPVTDVRTVPRALVASATLPTTPPTAVPPSTERTAAAAEQTGGPTAAAAPNAKRRTAKATAGAAATPKPARTTSPKSTRSGPVAAVIAATNAERAEAGCDPLRADSRLTVAAQGHASDMAANDYFSHTDQDGDGSAERIRGAGFGGSATGENIAYGQESATEVVTAWMDSAGHRSNILDCDYTRIGVGYDSHGDYWVQDFGG